MEVFYLFMYLSQCFDYQIPLFLNKLIISKVCCVSCVINIKSQFPSLTIQEYKICFMDYKLLLNSPPTICRFMTQKTRETRGKWPLNYWQNEVQLLFHLLKCNPCLTNKRSNATNDQEPVQSEPTVRSRTVPPPPHTHTKNRKQRKNYAQH